MSNHLEWREIQMRLYCEINQIDIFSVHYAVPSSSTSTTTSSSPSEWVGLFSFPKNHKWDDVDLSELPPFHWTGQGEEISLWLFSYLFTNTKLKYFSVSR